jgi:hypothetical protein
MTDKEFNKMAVEIPEVKELYKQWKIQKKSIDKTRRKLSRVKDKYLFLRTIIGIEKRGNELELAFKEFFKDIGYNDVRHIGGDNKYEDIIIWGENRLTVIEIKGTKQKMPTQADSSQVLKYLLERKNNYPDLQVHGITIVNHDNGKSPNNRAKNPFDKDRIRHAENGEYGLVSALDLFIDFHKIKRGIITFEDFDKRLHQKGLLEIGSKNKRQTRG